MDLSSDPIVSECITLGSNIMSPLKVGHMYVYLSRGVDTGDTAPGVHCTYHLKLF